MSQIRSALSLLMAIAGPLFLMLLGAVISLGLFPGEGSGTDAPGIPAQAGLAFLEDGEIVHIALNLERDPARTLVIHGLDGKILARFYAFRSGSFSLDSSEEGAPRFVFHRRPSGSIDVGLQMLQRQLNLVTRPDASAALRFRDDPLQNEQSVFLDAQGRISVDAHPTRSAP